MSGYAAKLADWLVCYTTFKEELSMTRERLYNEHYQIENFYGGFVDANDIINDNAQAEPTNRVLAEPFESEGAEEWQMPIRLVDGDFPTCVGMNRRLNSWTTTT